MPDAKCGFENGDKRGPAQQLLVVLGPTLSVDIGFDPDYVAGSGKQPKTSVTGCHAIVDTGAIISCIDSALAATLQLPIVDRQKVSGVGGLHEVNMHLAQVYVPDLLFTIHGSFAGVDLAAGGQAHVVLIGRTFLAHVKMHYDGTSGEVTISR
jgi:hypothetical protein